MWQDVIELIRKHDRFLVTSHVHPDGDAIGSEVALAAFLEGLGKTVWIVNSSPTPQSMTFLDPDGAIRAYPDDFGPARFTEVEVAFILDVNNWAHLGEIRSGLKASRAIRVCVDHHEGIDEGFADLHVTDTRAAATGILIYELIRAMQGDITRRIADAVYATVITDTGTFRFSNTDERAFLVSADLCRRGADPFTLHRRAFAKTYGAVRLLGAVLGTLRTTPDGSVAWVYANQEMFGAAGAEYEDSDSLLDIVRAVRDVAYCLFFKELPDGGVKVSLRSNGSVDVYEIARRFGGGGHRMASGMTVSGPLDEAIHSVISACTGQTL